MGEGDRSGYPFSQHFYQYQLLCLNVKHSFLLDRYLSTLWNVQDTFRKEGDLLEEKTNLLDADYTHLSSFLQCSSLLGTTADNILMLALLSRCCLDRRGVQEWET